MARNWILLAVALLAFILLPFFWFEPEFRTLAEQIRGQSATWGTASAVIAGLLALDIVLPVPSSLISTAAGALLGWPLGTAVIWSGMCGGCVAGYALGTRARGLAPREFERMRVAAERYGMWSLILFRAVPVLAEASVLFAGLTRAPFRRFLGITAASNLGIAMAYAFAGACSASIDSFLLAFGGAVGLPLLAMGLVRLLMPRRPSTPAALS